MDQDTAHAAKHTERTQRCTGAQLPRRPHTKHNTPSVHTAEQEPTGPGHRTRNTTRRAWTPLSSSQVAQDRSHATQHAERAHR